VTENLPGSAGQNKNYLNMGILSASMKMISGNSFTRREGAGCEGIRKELSKRIGTDMLSTEATLG
jgi:hypothetical protein